jgi:hypothetical protein
MSNFKGEVLDLGAKTSVHLQIEACLPGAQPATAGNFGTFFIADKDYVFITASEIHGTAGTDGSAVTLDVTNDTGTTAPAGGTSILGSTFNLKGTANTLQSIGVVGNFPPGTLILQGSRLAMKLTGTPTALANLALEVVLRGVID